MIPEDIRNLVGKPFGKTVFDIEKESVKRFADAVGDPNPLYTDLVYAASTGYGSLIAPPGYLSSPWYWGDSRDTEHNTITGLGDIIKVLIDAGYTQTFDSGIEYEFFEPVKVGDTITAEYRVKNIAERGKADEKAIFLFTESVYTNQAGKTVAISNVTTTHR